ncbi:MAG: acyloxyacyl hydrolase [Muribaculaceae bacterium]|nr:acyloxyacyl hydrolase [Muribaculaceae bacterium]
MNRTIIATALAMAASLHSMASDTAAPSGFRKAPQWHIGAELSPSWVAGTNLFLKGNNPEEKRISSSLAGGVRAGFSFNSASREGLLYRGLYQGVGLEVNTFFSNSLLGTPVSAYVYQGAPIAHLSPNLWLGYEWQFGAAFGWKHFDSETASQNAAVSTSVTAHMGIGLKLHYRLSDRCELSVGIGGKHYSNGNTSWPNAGVNTIGATVGIAYALSPTTAPAQPRNAALEQEADRIGMFYDIMVFGTWRKRVLNLGEPAEPMLCPGRFGILGIQFSPMCRLNRWFAAGPALDIQWDESGGLSPYWVEGSLNEYVKFRRPPFGKQLSIGLSAHAELTMPIFAVNCGLGYAVVNPKGDKRFYQSLTLKTFVTRRLYMNVGYRLGSFKDPQNLMIGVGVRL